MERWRDGSFHHSNTFEAILLFGTKTSGQRQLLKKFNFNQLKKFTSNVTPWREICRQIGELNSVGFLSFFVLPKWTHWQLTCFCREKENNNFCLFERNSKQVQMKDAKKTKTFFYKIKCKPSFVFCWCIEICSKRSVLGTTARSASYASGRADQLSLSDRSRSRCRRLTTINTSSVKTSQSWRLTNEQQSS